MQHHAIDLALENAGVDQAQKRLEQHFADAVKTLLERSGFQRREWLGSVPEPLHDGVKLRIVAVANDQALRQSIADLPDADLQRTTVTHEASGVKTDGIFGIGDRLRRRREQRKLGRGTVEHRAEFLRRQIAGARHERQFGIDLADQLERRGALRAGAQYVERGVGVAAQAVARNAVDNPLGHQLGDDIESTRQQV